MKCRTRKYRTSVISFVFLGLCILVVRSHIQTHEQNIQLGRHMEAGKMVELGRHETRQKHITRRTI